MTSGKVTATRTRQHAIAAILALGLVASNTIAPPSADAINSAQLTFASYEDAVPAVIRPGAEATAVYLDQFGRAIPMSASGPAPQGLWCTPISGRDNPHISSTVLNPVTISGHGWWSRGTCTKYTANVYNCLYEYYDDNSWRQKVCSTTRTLSPGGGSANRTAANRTCSSLLLTSWRNHVDVDVIDEWDSSEFPYNEATIKCRIT